MLERFQGEALRQQIPKLSAAVSNMAQQYPGGINVFEIEKEFLIVNSDAISELKDQMEVEDTNTDGKYVAAAMETEDDHELVNELVEKHTCRVRFNIGENNVLESVNILTAADNTASDLSEGKTACKVLFEVQR